MCLKTPLVPSRPPCQQSPCCWTCPSLELWRHCQCQSRSQSHIPLELGLARCFGRSRHSPILDPDVTQVAFACEVLTFHWLCRAPASTARKVGQQHVLALNRAYALSCQGAHIQVEWRRIEGARCIRQAAEQRWGPVHWPGRRPLEQAF